MDELFEPGRRSWVQKFAGAFRGWLLGSRGHSSFVVHVPVAIAVVVAAASFRVTAVEWCVLTLSIMAVMTAELFNSALEALAKAVTPLKNPFVEQALDIASGAVLFTAFGAVIVGMLIFIPRGLALLASLS